MISEAVNHTLKVRYYIIAIVFFLTAAILKLPYVNAVFHVVSCLKCTQWLPVLVRAVDLGRPFS